MTSRWAPGLVYSWVCGCGLRLIAGDIVELNLLKGEHADYHIGLGEWEA